MVRVNVEQGDIVDIDFSPSKCHEPAFRHFGVVVGVWEANIRSSLIYVVPITSTNNGHPFHMPVTHPFHMPVTKDVHCPIEGYAQCEALRALNLESRTAEGKCEVVGSISDGDLSRILGCILALLGQTQ